MLNIRTLIRPAAALLLAASAACAMAAGQTLAVSIIGPGGHSNGNYGHVNAVHAAARSIMLIEKAVPDAVVSDIQGGNSVNSIAASADFIVTITGDEASLKAQADKVKAAVEEGCKAENAFRGVKTGEVRNGVDEGKRVYRFLMMGLLASGYNLADGSVVEPNVGPMGNRTTEEMFK